MQRGYVGSVSCASYGMISGCDGECPVFASGRCVAVSEDPVSFRKMILETDLFSDWDFEEICSVYPELDLVNNV